MIPNSNYEGLRGSDPSDLQVIHLGLGFRGLGVLGFWV